MKKYIYLILLIAHASSAEPWVDTSNIFLRAQIQYLSGIGVIKTPINTYPIMWSDIAKDLKRSRSAELSQESSSAYSYVYNQLRLAKSNQKTIELNASFNDKRFTSFGDRFRDKNNISLHTTWMNDSIALKTSTTYNSSPIDGDKVRYDGSYIAGFLGNWVFSLGLQDRWWGPGWDSNLALTNNARPIPAFAVSRKSAEPFIIPFTSHEIPWTVTSFMGLMNDERIIEDTLLWGFRLSFKPFENLEIGITRLAQWGGEGRPQNSKTFWNVFIGKDNCGNSGRAGLDCGANKELEPGNQQAGYDMRYTLNFSKMLISVYGQYYAEDGSSKDNSSSILTEPQVQAGVDLHTNFLQNPTTIYLEYSDTFADCSDKNGIVNGNCFNEHHIYQTGMRFNQRTIGSQYDNDANTLVLGFISNINQDFDVIFKVRKLTLNKDNSDKAPNNPIIGNPLTKIEENILMFSTSFQYSYKNWRFILGGDVSKSSFVEKESENNSNFFINIEHNL